MKNFFRFITLMALLAIVSVTNSVDAAVYLDHSASNYNNETDSYWFAWTWSNQNDGEWLPATNVGGNVERFNTVEYKPNIIFVCMNSQTASWNNKKGQTGDKVIVDEGTFVLNNDMSGDWTNPTTTKVYLDPANFTNNNVWYAWAWVNDCNGYWYSGTTNGDLIEFNIPTTKDKIIFVKMNSSASNNPSWDNKISQTGNLDFTANGTYTLTGESNQDLSGYWKSESSNGKGIWHQDPNGDPNYYLSNRRALTGRHCMPNKLINVVGVGSWIDDLNNLTDEDISNYAEFPTIVEASVGANPIVSIRDIDNHYAAGTSGGYMMIASDPSVLGLDVIKTFSLAFYLEGELQGTKPVEQNTVDVLNLSLITIPGSDEPCVELSATSDWEFDEVALMPAGGINAQVVEVLKLRYAFVGEQIKNTVTYQSMANYAQSHGRNAFTLEQNGVSTNMIDDNLDNSSLLSAVLSFGGVQIQAQIDRNDPDQSQPFKAGSVVGFDYGTGSVLSLDVAKTLTIKLYKGTWVEKTNILGTTWEYELEEVQSTTVDGTVANVGLLTAGRHDINIVAEKDFTAMALISSGLLNVGGSVGYYAYVGDPAEVNHHCDLNLSANASICSKDTEYQLTANDSIPVNSRPVTWSIESQPSGANASIDAKGKITGMTVDGDYVVKATAADGCFDYVTITRGLFTSSATCDQPIVNNGETATYVLSENVNDGGSLININGNLQDPENVLNQSLEDYAMYSSVLNATVVENLPIVGVKKANGTFSDGNAHRIGFIVEAKSTGLRADVIDLFNIRTYKNGAQTASKVIKETNSVKVKLIGSNKEQKLRFAVDIPADVEFDEFILWKSGVLDLSIDRFKIYYAFDEAITDEDEPTECFDPLGCDAQALSADNGATLNGNEIQFAGAINVANVLDNLSYLVDGDLNTGVSITNTVSLGTGVVLAFDLGRVYTPSHQIGMVIDSKTYLARVKAGDWITMETYLKGEKVDSLSDWSVLGVNAIGYGDKSYIFMNPTSDYDEVRITIAAIANALSFDEKYYDIFVRNDYDQDGTPDCKDDDSCMEEYTLDEEATTLAKTQDYPNGNLALHRSFDLENWNCIILPVDLTWEQVRNAFGNEVEIATPSGFYYTPKLQTGSKATVLYYDPRTENADDNIAIHKNQYYIIKPFRDADITTGTYTAKDGETLNAPVYLIPGVTYLRADEKVGGVVDVLTVNYKELSTGTSQNAPRIKEETTENIILHGSQVYLDGDKNDNVAYGDNYLYGDNNTLTRVTNQSGAEMLGFRFYAENNTPNNVIHEEDWDTPTGIVDIFNDTTLKRNGVYTLDGRMIRVDNDITSLPAGIYIVGGKKVVIGTK